MAQARERRFMELRELGLFGLQLQRMSPEAREAPRTYAGISLHPSVRLQVFQDIQDQHPNMTAEQREALRQDDPKLVRMWVNLERVPDSLLAGYAREQWKRQWDETGGAQML